MKMATGNLQRKRSKKVYNHHSLLTIGYGKTMNINDDELKALMDRLDGDQSGAIDYTGIQNPKFSKIKNL